MTPREFLLKHAAFHRREDRLDAALIRLSLRIGHYEQKDRVSLEHLATAKTRYPIKRWTLPPGTTVEDVERALLRPRTIRDAAKVDDDPTGF